MLNEVILTPIPNLGWKTFSFDVQVTLYQSIFNSGIYEIFNFELKQAEIRVNKYVNLKLGD